MRKIVEIGVAVLWIVALGQQGWAAEPIKIGVLYPTSGSGAVYGTSAMLGHDMAVEEINAMGGIGGKIPIVTFARDTKLKPATASAAAKELITKEGVDVLMGGLSAAVGLAISEVARREKVIYIATIPKAIHMTTSKLHPYVFRTAPNTDIEGRGIARTIGQLGAKKLCQIQFDYAYGHDLAAGIAKALPQEAAGAEIVLDLKVKLGATDYNTYIAQIMGAGCEGVVSGLWGAAFITFAQQAQPFGFFEQVKYVSGGEIASHEIASKMKGNYPDNVWSNAYELWYHDASPLHKPYQQELARRQGRPDTDGWPILSYIGVKFIEAAVVKAESVETQALIAALEGLSIETPVGRRTIDAKTHQANTGQFWGPMKKTDEHEFRIMDPITYISGD